MSTTEPRYTIDFFNAFTAAEYAEENDGEELDERITSLSMNESVEIDFGAGGIVTFTRIA